MTLKKSKRNLGIEVTKGQSIFEYFLLTTVVVAVVLFFTSKPHLQLIRNSCEAAFDKGVGQIEGIDEGDKIGEIK